jgi:16S rRNA (uracil1498-N3)-methyltransferase
MTRPRFVVSPSSLTGDRCELRGSEFRHLRVRRLRPGSSVNLTDGAGQERTATVLSIERDHAVFALQPVRAPAPEGRVRLVLAQSLLKSDRFDLVVEKATELGVDAILPFSSARTVAHGSSTRFARWTRIALSATKQSQRRTVPQLSAPATLADILARDVERLRLLLWEDAPDGGSPPMGLSRNRPTSILLVVGPEGGFTAAEAAAAVEHGFHLTRLGDRPLRSETAALAGLAVCQFLWGSFGQAVR